MTEPKKETISEKEFKAEEAEREKRFNAMLQRIKCVIFVSHARRSDSDPTGPSQPLLRRG